MSEHYLHVRLRSPEGGRLFIRDSVSLTFYMPQPHQMLAANVMRSIDLYMAATHARLMECVHYSDHAYDWSPLDDVAWERIRKELLEGATGYLSLDDEAGEEQRYGIDYRGRSAERPYLPGAVSALRFWLSTEYLEEHGPQRVRELALDLLGSLPICSGNVGLSFHGSWESTLRRSLLSEFAFRYPGMDIGESTGLGLDQGTRLMGISWLTFLGQPALGEVGGVAGLRSRLGSPEITVEELTGDRAVITLGEWPASGDTHEGRLLPSYRELARVLEPILYREEREHWQGLFNSPEELRRWQRRFLD